MEKGRTRSYEECVVREAIVFHEGIESKDDFGYPQNLKPSISGELNTKTHRAEARVGAVTIDYTKQLQFHQQELAQAEQRGFPPGQIQYHVEKIRVLRELVNNVVQVDFVKRQRL